MTEAPIGAAVGGVDLDAVAAAVRSCPGVDDLDGGPSNAQLATYLPGRKIDGLKLTADTLTVQIRSVWNVPVTEVGAQIRLAVTHLVDDRLVDIVVADLTPAPGYELQSKEEPVWMNELLTAKAISPGDVSDGSSFGSTTPTPGEIPPRS